MKIVLHSHLFFPSIGGVEQVGLILAEEFQRSGHQVRVSTQTARKEPDAFPFSIIRRPALSDLWSLIRWADVIFHNNISLRGPWPWPGSPVRWVVAHHTWIRRPNGRLGWQDRLKRSLLRFADNISVSQAIAHSLPVPSTVISNPYDDKIFSNLGDAARRKDLIFVGRLVSDKGMDLLLEALIRMSAAGLKPGLTVVGSGPELEKLQRQARQGALVDQVDFVGAKTGSDLARLLNQHRILVVPSRWEEPFGLVALEGIACGCVIVGSEKGGLTDAIGPCGVTFPNGDADALKNCLSTLLGDKLKIEMLRSRSASHLQAHRRSVVAERYLSVFAPSVQDHGRPQGTGHPS